VARTSFERELRRAINNDELVLHYQPIVHTSTGEIQGYEALVRWDRPGLGMLSPADFIPVAEQSDLICELGSWVCHTATLQLAAWNVITGHTNLVMAVNISALHLSRSRIVADVSAAVTASGIQPSQLIIEITETAVIDDSSAMLNLEALRRLGPMIAIDDFGTGYSSITRLERLPVDILKIDRHFLEPGNPKAEVLLRLMVETAYALGLWVIAEGVEEEPQRRLLEAFNCPFAQGYLLGRPVARPRVEERPGLQRTLTPVNR
jgi:EAL domain-containing protein (putative c-di-GMP-specific phosphodiesterase class I)